MFERLDPDARKVLFLSKFHAAALGETLINPEHLLSGLLRQNDPVTLAALQAVDVDLERLREQCQVAVQLPDPPAGDPMLSPQARRIVGSAASVADEVRLAAVGPSCLLLAIVRERENTAARLLGRYGVTYEQLVERVRHRE